MKATFVEKKQLTEGISSFSFKPAQPYRYTSGQFIELTLSGHHEDGKPAKRWFTLSSTPLDALLTITTRVGTDQHSVFKRALNNLASGAEVDISEPMGDFVLPKFIQTPLIFIAGGIGVTPFRSMLEWLALTSEQRPIRMLYSVKKEEDIIFQDTFDAAKQHVTIVVDDPSAAWGGERGHLTAEMVLGLKQPTDDTLLYISGPEPFVQKLQADLIALGVSRQQIVVDEFQGYEAL
ncbi:FAD-dependent oxidoreductase [soil metagenome]